MSANTGSTEKTEHELSKNIEESDFDLFLQDDGIDWNSFSLDEFSSLGGCWNGPVTEVVFGFSKDEEVTPPGTGAPKAFDGGPEVGGGICEPLELLMAPESLPLVSESLTAEEHEDPSVLQDDLDFSDLINIDPSIVEKVDLPAMLNDFDSPCSSPKDAKETTGAVDQDSVLESFTDHANQRASQEDTPTPPGTSSKVSSPSNRTDDLEISRGSLELSLPRNHPTRDRPRSWTDSSAGYPNFKKRDEITGKPYERTLTHRMSLTKQKHQRCEEATTERAAGQRGRSLGSHKGDLVINNARRANTRIHDQQNQLIANPRQRRSYRSDAVADENDIEHDDKQRQAQGNERIRKLRHHIPALDTSIKTIPSSAPQQLGENYVTCGKIASSLAFHDSRYQLDENRKFIMPTKDLLSPHPSNKPQQRYKAHQPQLHEQNDLQPPINQQQPHSRMQQQHQEGLESRRQGLKRSSDEAGNDNGATSNRDHIANLNSHRSPDAGARPIKKIKASQRPVLSPSSQQLAQQKQAHQRQALQKVAHQPPIPPPPGRPQASQPSLFQPQSVIPSTFQSLPPLPAQAGNGRGAIEASSDHTSSRVVAPSRPSTFGTLSSSDRRQSKKLKQTHDLSITAPVQTASQQGSPVQHNHNANLEAERALVAAVPHVPTPQPQFEHQQLSPPLARSQRTGHEASLSLDGDSYEIPAPSNGTPADTTGISGQIVETESTMDPSMRQSSVHQGGHSRPGYLPQQHIEPGYQQNSLLPHQYPYDHQQSYYPATQHSVHEYSQQGRLQQRPPQRVRLQRYSDDPNVTRQIMENYERYMQQNSNPRRKTPRSPKSGKRPAEALGSDGKMIKKKQGMRTRESKKDKKALYEDPARNYEAQRLLLELRQPEWEPETPKVAKEQRQTRIEQVEVDAEWEARQKGQEERDKDEFRREEERAAGQREIRGPDAMYGDTGEFEKFLTNMADDEE